MSAILAIVSWFIVKDKDSDKPKISSSSILCSVLNIFKNRQTWFYGAYGFICMFQFLDLPIFGGVSYIMQAFNADFVSASGVFSSFYIGIGLGFWFTNLSKNYTKSLFFSAITTCFLFIILIYFPCFPFIISYPLLFMCGFSAAGQFLAFVCITSLYFDHNTATASGVQNMVCMVSGIVMQPVIGYLFDLTKNSSLTLSTLSGLRFALSIIPISLVIAFILPLVVQGIGSFQALNRRLLYQDLCNLLLKYKGG